MHCPTGKDRTLRANWGSVNSHHRAQCLQPETYRLEDAWGKNRMTDPSLPATMRRNLMKVKRPNLLSEERKMTHS